MSDDQAFVQLARVVADLEERVRTIEQFIAVQDPYDLTVPDAPVDVYDPDGDYSYNDD
jgi:hypothetical protein